MEDRTWAYEQADNVSLENVRNLKEVCYVFIGQTFVLLKNIINERRK